MNTLPHTSFEAAVGAYCASSDASQSDRQLLSLVVELAMEAVGGRCVVELGGASFAAVCPGEAVAIRLDSGGGAVPVFTGAAYACECGTATQVVHAADAIATLVSQQVEAAYEAVDAGFIIKDLLGQTGVAAGTVSPAVSFPAYALHAGPALGHLRRIAALTGADIYTDGQGRVHVATPRDGAADHSFTFGETILALDLRRSSPATDGVTLWGEGAASAKGSTKAHWLSTELDGVKGEAAVDGNGTVKRGDSGTRPRRASDGAVRSGGAAADAAAAQATALAARQVQGSIEVTAAAAVSPGDLVAIEGLPSGHGAAGLLAGVHMRVRSVRHVLSRRAGLRTRLEF